MLKKFSALTPHLNAHEFPCAAIVHQKNDMNGEAAESQVVPRRRSLYQVGKANL